jgi:hypothetical protein
MEKQQEREGVDDSFLATCGNLNKVEIVAFFLFLSYCQGCRLHKRRRGVGLVVANLLKISTTSPGKLFPNKLLLIFRIKLWS